ncbi:ribonuclease Z [Piscinibacter koreensis]|uniref:Ribonuclease Z n=1 Tax=Piscinibacter koreensis TaxID=2742824 RepID=A0A7Y6TWF8_9BURK|nr:MBL fold metallo-hydrolase [Schlegelella koreensis]NUZ06003.1 ribonuclease Z [Schlegelella koreensis]
MRTTLDVRLLDPTGNEPGLVVDLRDERRALLFDLGEIERLAPRVLLRASHAFVTHTHMDHFAGFDHWLALALGRVPHFVLWGGPGFVDQLEHKLRAYTWNVVHRYEVAMTIEAHSFEADGTRRHARFTSVDRFARGDFEVEAPSSDDRVLLGEPLFDVRASLVDHEMPVLAFAIDEKAQVRVAADRIAARGLATGAWLRTLKDAVLAGASDDTPIDVEWSDRGGRHAERFNVGELRPLVLDTVPGRRIGYVTDLRFTPDNVERLVALLEGADLLFIESVFLDADRDHAARKNHLTAPQAGTIARRIGARKVVPFHFSPRYRGREAELRAEVAAAWGGVVHDA